MAGGVVWASTITTLQTTTTMEASRGIINTNFTNLNTDKIQLTDLSSTATGLTYTNTTGAFSLTTNYNIPLTASTTNWQTAYNWGDHSVAGYLKNLVEDTTPDLGGNLRTGSYWLSGDGGNEGIYIDSTGNVGIGTTSPSTNLDVVGKITVAPSGTTPDNAYNGNVVITKPAASGQYLNFIRSGTNAWSLGTVYNTNTFGIGAAQNTDSNFTSPAFTLTTAGAATLASSLTVPLIANVSNLRVGATSLNIDNNAGTNNLAALYNSGGFKLLTNTSATGSTQGSGIEVEQQGSGDATLNFLLSNTERWLMGIDHSDSNKFKISEAAAGDFLSSAFTIDTNNNVGIGTTSPSQLLTVGNNNQFTVSSAGAITGLSYGGITEANLLDKSASETITGTWGFATTTATDLTVSGATTLNTAWTGILRADSGVLSTTTAGASEWTDGGTILYPNETTDRVLVGTSTNATTSSIFESWGKSYFYNGAGTSTPALDVQNTTDAVSNQVAIFRAGNRATPANNDEGYISFYGDDNAGNSVEFARMAWVMDDVITSTKDSTLKFYTRHSNTLSEVMSLSYGNLMVKHISADSIGSSTDFTVSAGNNIYLVPESRKIYIFEATSAASAILDTSLINTSDQTFTFPDASGTFALLETANAFTATSTLVTTTITKLTVSGATTLTTPLDISSNTNLAAGRSLTMSGDSVEADAEIYTDTKCLYWESPLAADDFKSIWRTTQAVTITQVWCESDQTIAFDLQEDDGSPADIIGVDLQCAAGENSTSTAFADAAIAANSRIDLAVTSVSGTPTWASICFTYTKDD